MNARDIDFRARSKRGSTHNGQVILRRNDLASIDTYKLGILNSLYSNGGFECGEHVWRWQRAPATATDHWVQLECGREQLWLGIIAATIDAGIDFSWRNFDGSARQIAWCASYPQILEMSRQVFTQDWLPTQIHLDLEPDHSLIDAGFVIAGFTIDRAGHRIVTGRCWFRADSPQCTGPANVGPLAPIMSRLPIAIPIVVDRAALAVDELRKLNIGAVIRVNRRAFLDIGAQLRLSVGGTDFLVKVTGTKLTVVDIETRSATAGINLENEMTTNENQEAQDDGDADDSNKVATVPIDLASMPVDVRFEAGRLVTCYDELCRIQPGYTYELGHTLGEQTIDITANGALIARGELVNVGDQLGVRITALGSVPRAIG